MPYWENEQYHGLGLRSFSEAGGGVKLFYTFRRRLIVKTIFSPPWPLMAISRRSETAPSTAGIPPTTEAQSVFGLCDQIQPLSWPDWNGGSWLQAEVPMRGVATGVGSKADIGARSVALPWLGGRRPARPRILARAEGQLPEREGPLTNS